MAFTLPDLPYAHNALEPAFDARTMEIHHGKHHAGYVAKLNAAVDGTEFADLDIAELCSSLDRLPDALRGAVRNNGGGHYNHSLFWTSLCASGQGGAPSGALADAINQACGSFDGFKDAFANAAATRFGSGWAWLVKTADGGVAVGSTPNQDNPLMGNLVEVKGTPLLGLDVWEHAYYLHYQNRRPDYISAFWDIVNWNAVSERFGS